MDHSVYFPYCYFDIMLIQWSPIYSAHITHTNWVLYNKLRSETQSK